jgi:hypothetical protein
MKLAVLLMSCPERAEVRARTLASFRRTDFGVEPEVVCDDRAAPEVLRGITATWQRMLRRALELDAEYYLLLEDDLEFNPHLRHNLLAWRPLRASEPRLAFYASLYNPMRPHLRRHDAERYFIADPSGVWGSQALVLSRGSVAYMLRFWDDEEGAADIKMARLAARVGPIYYHVPSLVQHTGRVSTWGGMSHHAPDFDPGFKAAQSDHRAA